MIYTKEVNYNYYTLLLYVVKVSLVVETVRRGILLTSNWTSPERLSEHKRFLDNWKTYRMTSSSEIYLKSEIRKVDLDSDTRYQKSRTLCHPRKPVSHIAANYVGTPSGIIYTKKHGKNGNNDGNYDSNIRLLPTESP